MQQTQIRATLYTARRHVPMPEDCACVTECPAQSGGSGSFREEFLTKYLCEKSVYFHLRCALFPPDPHENAECTTARKLHSFGCGGTPNAESGLRRKNLERPCNCTSSIAPMTFHKHHHRRIRPCLVKEPRLTAHRWFSDQRLGEPHHFVRVDVLKVLSG